MNFMEFAIQLSERPATQEELDAVNSNLVGVDKTLGITYTHLEKGRVAGRLEYSEKIIQPVGIVHGGVYAAFAESLGSVSGIIAMGQPVVGVNNSTDFISSVKDGVVEAVATPIQLGRRTQLWNIEMSQEGKLVARTTLRTMVAQAR